MAIAKLTLIGFEEYLQSYSQSLFSSWTPPANTINKDEFISNLFHRAGELPVLYADPYVLQFYIGVWGTKINPAIERIFAALEAEYNPIHNYDRMEDESTTGARSSTEDTRESDAGSTSRTRSGEDSGSSTGSTRTDGSTVNEQENTAYDADTYKAVQRDTSTVGDSQSTVSSSANRQSETEEGADSRSRSENRQASETHGDARTLHAYGNIGVTTAAEMITQEMILRQKYNIYDVLAEMFMTEFCIPVY